MKQEIFDDYKIIFKTSQEEVEIKCVKYEKLANIFEIYCKIQNIDFKSVVFIYNGKTFCKDDYPKTIEQIANVVSKSEKLINILVEQTPKDVNLVFCYLGKEKKENVYIDDTIESKFYKFLLDNEINRDNAILKYKDNIVNTELTINQFINKYTIDIGDWKEENDNQKPIEIKMDVINGIFKKIVFIYRVDDKYENFYNIEKKMKDIFSDYAKDKNKDKNKLDFKYKDKSIDDNQTLKDFLQNNMNKINEEEENKTTVDINVSKMKDKEPTININVIDLPCFSYFFKVYKIPFFIVLGLIVIAGITILLIFLLRNDSDDKSSSQKIPTIPADYFIKAIYTSDQSETVYLISNAYNLNKIKNMSIDGDISKPLRSFTFAEKGEHTIYLSFNN